MTIGMTWAWMAGVCTGACVLLGSGPGAEGATDAGRAQSVEVADLAELVEVAELADGATARAARRELVVAIDGVQMAARALRRGGLCRVCTGTGDVQRRARIGSRSAGGSMRVPVHADFVVACTVCLGGGYASSDRLLAQLGRLHEALVALRNVEGSSPTSIDATLAARRDRALGEAHAAVAALAARDPEALRQLLAENARRHFARCALSASGPAEGVLRQSTGRAVDRDQRQFVAFVSDRPRGPVRGHTVRVDGERVRIASTLWAGPVGPAPTSPGRPTNAEDSTDFMVETVPDIAAEEEEDEHRESEGEAKRSRSDASKSSAARAMAGPVLVFGRLSPAIVGDDGTLHVVEDAAVVRAGRPDAR